MYYAACQQWREKKQESNKMRVCGEENSSSRFFQSLNAQHEIANLRIFNSCVKKRKYRASSL